MFIFCNQGERVSDVLNDSREFLPFETHTSDIMMLRKGVRIMKEHSPERYGEVVNWKITSIRRILIPPIFSSEIPWNTVAGLKDERNRAG